MSRSIARCLLIVGVSLVLVPGHTARAGTPPVKASPPGAYGAHLAVHGFSTLWLRFGQPPADGGDVQTAFRVRFARLVVLARPATDFTAKVVLAFDNTNPLFNYQLEWGRYRFANLRAGQFKVPLGASVLTPAHALVFMDRPLYVARLTKARYRDIGIMAHTGKPGLLGGLLHYDLGVFNGSGVLGAGPKKIAGSLADLLGVARVVFSPGARLLTGGRLDVGLTVAYERQPPVAGKADAAEYLGRNLTPFTADRATVLGGGDVTFSGFGVWARAEVMSLGSRALDGSASAQALGWNVDLAYTFAPIHTQVAVRFERYDPNVGTGGDDVSALTVGVNYLVNGHAELSLFGVLNADHAGPSGHNLRDNHVDSRFQLKF